MSKNKLYPVVYMGAEYTEETISEVFETFYHSKSSVRSDGGIYMFDGMVIYPDGSMIDITDVEY